MIAHISERLKTPSPDLLTSKLFDEVTFYSAFLNDLKRCKSEVVIESPFITSRRMASLFPVFHKLRSCGIGVVINTRDPEEHDEYFKTEAEAAITLLQSMGVQVLFTDGQHRKLAILDRKILWEGSLNILSQNASCEVMRRIESEDLAFQMIRFIRLGRFL